MTAPGTRARRKWLPWFTAIIAVGLLAVLGLNIYAATAGAPATQQRPFTWDGESTLSVVYHGSQPHTTGCVISPSAGQQRELEVPSARLARYANISASTVRPWFDGSAEVICPQGRVFIGAGAVAVEYRNYPAMIVIIGVFAVGLLWRRGRRD